MRKIIILFVAMGLAFGSAPIGYADTVDFVATATVPAATGVSIVATEVESSTNNFGSQVSELNFDPMSYDSVNGIYLPSVYFAIDVGAVGGAGSPDVTVTYTEGTKPAGQTNGLGWKTTATFVKVSGSPGSEVQTDMAAHGPKQLLKDLSGENVTDTELEGGFLRLYVGVYTGDDAAITSAGGEVFSNADKAGTYTGTLSVTATVT